MNTAPATTEDEIIAMIRMGASAGDRNGDGRADAALWSAESLYLIVSGKGR